MGQLKEFQLNVGVWMDKMGWGWQFEVWRRLGGCLKTTQRFWLDKLPPPSLEDKALSRSSIWYTLLLWQWWESFFCFLVQIKYSSSLSFLLFEHSHQAGVKVLVGEILGAQPGEAGVEVLAPFSPTYCPFSCHKIPCIQKKCPAWSSGGGDFYFFLFLSTSISLINLAILQKLF